MNELLASQNFPAGSAGNLNRRGETPADYQMLEVTLIQQSITSSTPWLRLLCELPALPATGNYILVADGEYSRVARVRMKPDHPRVQVFLAEKYTDERLIEKFQKHLDWEVIENGEQYV